jgi:hypothetical protein
MPIGRGMRRTVTRGGTPIVRMGVRRTSESRENRGIGTMRRGMDLAVEERMAGEAEGIGTGRDRTDLQTAKEGLDRAVEGGDV